MERLAQQPVPDFSHLADLRELTAREREVLDLLSRGLSGDADSPGERWLLPASPRI
jgi:hypothetical protein